MHGIHEMEKPNNKTRHLSEKGFWLCLSHESNESVAKFDLGFAL